MKLLKEELAKDLAREIEPGEVLVFQVGGMRYVLAPTSKVPVVIDSGEEGDEEIIEIDGEFSPEERDEAVRSLRDVLNGSHGIPVEQLIKEAPKGPSDG